MPPGDEPVIVDTNILFSSLLSRHSSFADVLLRSDRRFFACEQVIVELFKRKEKLVESSELGDVEAYTASPPGPPSRTTER